MAIKPEQAKELTPREREQIANLESKIDQEIINTFKEKQDKNPEEKTTTISIKYQFPKNVSYRVAQKIAENYENEGWTVSRYKRLLNIEGEYSKL